MFDYIKAMNDVCYSDLYKEVYNVRPRDVTFSSKEEFDEDVAYLHRRLKEQIEEQKITHMKNTDDFQRQLDEIKSLVSNSNDFDAFRLLLQSEKLEEDFKHYGTEVVEWKFNLPYGSLEKFNNMRY